MKAAGLRGVRRSRQVFTTRPDKNAGRHPDLVMDAIEMARWNHGARNPGLRCHYDAGSQAVHTHPLR